MPIETLPEWGEWGDSRKVAVLCKKCRCCYTAPQWSQFGNNGKGGIIGGVPADGCTSCKERAESARRRALPIDRALVKAVRDHATANYERDGWDYIVESYTDQELWELIAGSASANAAITSAHETAQLHDMIRQDRRGGFRN